MTDDTTRKTVIPREPFAAPHVMALAVIEGREVDAIHRIVAAQTVIGRDGEADFQLDDPEVSKRHAEVQVSGGVASLIDLHSKNGTTLNARQLNPGIRERLKHLDEIHVGDTRLLFLSGRYRGRQ